MEIKKVLLNEAPMKKVCKKYKTEDVNLKIKDNKVFISAETTALYSAKIVFENTFFTDEAIVLGDAWERAYADLAFKKTDIN